jgi:hypothetical protein
MLMNDSTGFDRIRPAKVQAAKGSAPVRKSKQQLRKRLFIINMLSSTSHQSRRDGPDVPADQAYGLIEQSVVN